MGVLALWAFLPAACSTSQNLASSGQACLTATDCQPGLVCVPQGSGQSVCSDDLSGVQKTEGIDSGATAEASAEGSTAGEGGSVQDASNDTTTMTPMDSSTAKDTSAPVDTGIDTGPADTGIQ